MQRALAQLAPRIATSTPARFVRFSTSSMAQSKGDISKAHVTGVEDLPNPKWIKIQRVLYKDPLGQERDWEFASRQTRAEGADCDGVGILAILHKPDGPELLLQKQFRPPVEGICIEVPAGLLDPSESPETCAVRELHEETGYIGVARRTSPLMFNDPGFCNTNMKLVEVDIDLTDARNWPENLKPELEDNEFIDTFSVPLQTLPEEMNRLVAEGYKLDARVENIVNGFELARKFREFL